MKNLTILVVGLALIAAMIGFQNKTLTVIQEPDHVLIEYLDAEPNLESKEEKSEVLKVASKEKSYKVIKLEKANTLSLYGPVTPDSTAKLMVELLEMSSNLIPNDEIFLILNTPGGDVFSGLDLIYFAKALPQKINTITLFAASMGFHIVQSFDTRYITPNGTLMAHRATVGGVGGQLKGEFESKYKMLMDNINLLDGVSSSRMGLTLKEFESKHLNEYWVRGDNAVQDNAADETALIACGESLRGVVQEEVAFMGMLFDVTYSACPLISTPIKVQIKNKNKKISNAKVEEIVEALKDPIKFVRLLETNM